MQLDIKRNHALLKSCPRVSNQVFWGSFVVVIFPKGKEKVFFLCCKDTSWSRSQGMAKYLLHFSYCIQMNTFVYASNTNKLGKIGCKTRGAWKSQMTFITFCYCLLFVVRYKELRLAVARIRMVLEKESKQKSPLVNLVLLFPHGTKWTLRPTLCFWLLVLWNLVILVSMTNLTNIMIKRKISDMKQNIGWWKTSLLKGFPIFSLCVEEIILNVSSFSF